MRQPTTIDAEDRITEPAIPVLKERRWGRLLLRLTLVCALVVTAVLGAAWVWFDRNVLSTLPDDLTSLADARPTTACEIYDANGDRLDQFYVERRFHVPLAELPSFVPSAFVSAEDRRFWEHPGVDLYGIARAVVVNLKAGRNAQGGSTITQQIVKNLVVGNERSYTRKMAEAVLAYRLEKELGKEAILELYINYIALGSGNYGVEAAARDYFGVSARDLNLGQAALIAGLVPAPSRYSPWVNPQLAERRRELVLRSMVRDGLVDAASAMFFLDEPVFVPRIASRAHPAAAYATQVRREVRTLFGGEVPTDLGLQIHTPLDRRIQDVAQQAVEDALVAHAQRQGPRAIDRRLAPDDVAGFLARAGGLSRDPDTGAVALPVPEQCFDAVVGADRSLLTLTAGPHTLSLLAAQRSQLVTPLGTEDVKKVPLNRAVQPGDVLAVCATEDGAVALDPAPWAEAAVVAVENSTGRIKAIVGGRSVALEGFVRATQARLQPGSTFKPYVYGTALLHGATQLDTVLDAPLSLPAGGGKTWRPKNYGGGYAGAMPMRSALARSLNTVAVRLIISHGPTEVSRVARAMGVRTPIRRDPTIALGSSEVTVLDQAMGYATIARLGRKAEPVWIDRVLGGDGSLLGVAGEEVRLGDRALGTLPGGPGEEALPPGVAYELADMMREVVRAGTARSASVPGLDRAGKTGTTNSFEDAWFVGFTPRWTVAVWVGTDGDRSLGDKETGGKSALPIWKAVVTALGETQGERLPVPPETLFVAYEGRWVALDRATVPDRYAGATAPPDAPLRPFSRAKEAR